MASSLYPRFKQSLLSGAINLTSVVVKAALVDITTYALPVAAVTQANPAVISTAVHGLSAGHLVSVAGVVGATAVNGLWRVGAASLGATTLSLVDPVTGAAVVGNAPYISGGRIIPLSLHQFRSSLTGVASLTAALTTKTVSTEGVFDCDDSVFALVTAGNACGAVVLYVDTGNAATDNLIAYLDNMSGLPVTPNGADIPLTFDTGSNKVIAL